MLTYSVPFPVVANPAPAWMDRLWLGLDSGHGSVSLVVGARSTDASIARTPGRHTDRSFLWAEELQDIIFLGSSDTNKILVSSAWRQSALLSLHDALPIFEREVGLVAGGDGAVGGDVDVQRAVSRRGESRAGLDGSVVVGSGLRSRQCLACGRRQVHGRLNRQDSRTPH